MRNQAQQLLANVLKQASRGFACGTGGAHPRFAARAGEEVICVKGVESAPQGVMQVGVCSRPLHTALQSKTVLCLATHRVAPLFMTVSLLSPVR